LAAAEYKCVNFAVCNKALEHEVIEIEDGEDPVCPECASRLEPLKPTGTGVPKWLVPALVGLCVLGLGLWFALRPKPAPVPAPAPAPRAGAVPAPGPGKPLPPVPPSVDCTDTQLAGNIKERLAHEEDLRNTPIQVDVTNKTVILSGTVESDLARNYAADLAQRTGCHVAGVVNDLKVGPSDKSITGRIHQAFAQNASLRNQPILVEVSHANVVLSGSVSENIARTVAATTASQIPGVATVTNNLTVHPVSSSASTGGVNPPNTARISREPPPAPHASLTGTWMGSYFTCAGAETMIRMQVTEPTPDDVTASVEIAVPNAPSASFVSHGILNTMNGFLALQFNGWQHQPPGFTMGNIGGFVTFLDGAPSRFSGVIRSPGCGHVQLRRQ